MSLQRNDLLAIGYEFKTTNEEEEKQPETTFDPTVCSPIFFSNHYHKQDQTQLCDICHLPSIPSFLLFIAN